MNSTLFNVGLSLSIALMVVTAAAPASAQTTNYAVEARAVTGTMPGAGATYVGPLMGEVEAEATHDPAARQWVYNINQLLYSDAAAHAWTEMGALAAHVSVVAQRVLATNFPPGVTASTTSKYYDRFQVVSATLAKGTPVTLTFANTMNIDWQGSGLYDGKASCVLQVGGWTSTSQWSAATDKPAASVVPPPLVVKTTVGATLSLSGRLETFTRGSFFVPGPKYDGQIAVDASCDTPLVGVTDGVELVAESGVDYASL